MKTCGGGDQTGREGFSTLYFTLIPLFKAHFAAFISFFGFDLYFNWANEHPHDLQCVGENEIIHVLKNLCGSSKFNFSKKRALFLHRFELLMKTFDPFLLDLFSSGNASYFYLEDVRKQVLKSHTVLFVPKKYILVISLIYSLFGQIV